MERSAGGISKDGIWPAALGFEVGLSGTARFVFLDSKAEDSYLDGERAARDTIAVLRSAAGRNPHGR
ncbi:MAG TPA: hypothetical protein VGG54_32580, partial [Trebonia sp.]